MKEALLHYEANKDTFDLWINEKSKLQVSNDIFLPIIPEFKKAFPSVNLDGCQECIIDMLVWIKSEWKKSNKK
jgi:hypothetical protein